VKFSVFSIDFIVLCFIKEKECFDFEMRSDDPNGMDVSSSHIGIGTFEPIDHPDEDVKVIMEEVPPATEVSQHFFDAKSSLDDNYASHSDGSVSSFTPKASNSPRRPSDVGSIPLKPLVRFFCFMDRHPLFLLLFRVFVLT
jgi:hypothetical protein